MEPSSRTPEGRPNLCPVRGNEIRNRAVPAGWRCTVPLLRSTWSGSPRCRIRFGISTDSQFRISPSARARKQFPLSSICWRSPKRLTAEQRQGILKALQDRETLGSTGIGRGLAVPHAKYSVLAQLIGAVANFPADVDFKSLDGNRSTSSVYSCRRGSTE